jgi:uncharacterized protein (TIGR02996 family)
LRVGRPLQPQPARHDAAFRPPVATPGGEGDGLLRPLTTPPGPLAAGRPFPEDTPVTTEEAFQAHLDEHPDDHTAREIFADWLDEQDDPRGPGMRALGVLRLWPESGAVVIGFWWWEDKNSGSLNDHHSRLPLDWAEALEIPGSEDGFYPRASCPGNTQPTRREVENAAALAFAKLPAARQAELLKSNEPAVK